MLGFNIHFRRGLGLHLSIAGLLFATGACMTEVETHSLIETAEQAGGISTEDIWIAALGDSFASGEGNPNIIGAPLNSWKWLDDEGCHRSVHAWPYAVAATIGGRASASKKIRLSFLACSGATASGLDDQLVALESQISAAGREPDVVLLSAGGNDLAFAELVWECIGFGDVGNCPGQAQVGDMEKLRGEYRAIAGRLAGVPSVFLLAYPNPLEGRKRGVDGWSDLQIQASCVLTASASGWTWLNDNFARPLLELQREVAEEHEWHLLDDHLEVFEKHSYCPREGLPGADSWWVGILPTVFRQWGVGAFHPNKRGHAAIAEAALDPIARALGVINDDDGQGE